MRKQFWVILLTVSMMAVLFAGCKKTEEAEKAEEVSSEVIETEVKEESSEETAAAEETAEESSEESLEEESSVEAEEPRGPVNPLTGEAAEEDMTGRRPYVFMCNNISLAMPQVGVSQADMIMEMMEEGGITRFMVWFMDPFAVEKIGSIRSARQYNVETAIGYNAFLCHCGGSGEALGTIQSYGVEDMDAIYGDWGGVYYRDPNRQTYGIEHSMFARGTHAQHAIEEIKGYDPMHPEGYDGTYGMIFSDHAVDQCTEDAENVFVFYAGGKTTKFIYDAESGSYTMYQYGNEYTDDGVGGIPFANVINMYADTMLQSDGTHLSIYLNSGSGTFFTGGRCVPILWYKDGWEDCFHFTLEDGSPLQFSVGKTFFCVNQTGDYHGDCQWN